MSNLDDTCILHRGSRPALRQAQIGAGLVLRHGGCGTSAGRHHLDVLDRLFVSANLSPGGSADLLAAVLFLDSIEKMRVYICD
jgi:triphosphoribosyl-dephospho-CoA synthase